jgi:phage/plasmid-like protein (TIGR03299 family)
MAHELLIERGKASMMFVGEDPWHHLGTKLASAPKTAEEAIKAANLDWLVGLKPVYVWEGEHFYKIQDRKAVVRLDKWGTEECHPFGVVGNDYRALQNREAFSFFDPIVETGQVSYHTAGALGRGERVWVLAKVETPMLIGGSDKVEKYLLLSNGHDGRTSVQVRFTPIRVVCHNTLSAALASGTDLMKSYHTSRMHKNLRSAQEAVKSVLDHYKKLEDQFEVFARKPMDSEKTGQYVNSVFPDPKRKSGQSERAYNSAVERNQWHRDEGQRLFTHGRGNQEARIKGTLWAAYNGITELVDHHWGYESRAQRLSWLWFGEEERIKLRAFEEAARLAKN